MNCHERTTAALNLQGPDRVPVFSCTEEQNQIYEILGEADNTVPLRSKVKVVIGGACTTPELAAEIGCDAHGADAVAAVRVCEQLLRT